MAPTNGRRQHERRPQGAAPKKSLGQHFLTDRSAVWRIVEAVTGRAPNAAPSAGSPQVPGLVVEVGPGPGVLTGPLASFGGKLICVELDDELAARLQEHFSSTPGVTVVHADILETTVEGLLAAGGVEPGTPYVVAGNLPYNIGAAILRHFLEAQAPPQRMVVMLQREVAELICAEPGDLGILGVSVQVYATPKRLFNVPPGSFAPPPKVMSSVIELTRRETPLLTPEERETFFATLRAGFSAPRKQLHNTLVQGLHIGASQADAALAAAGIEPSLRPSILSVEDWVRLSRVIGGLLRGA